MLWGASTVSTFATSDSGTEPPVWVGIMTLLSASMLVSARLSPRTVTVISSPFTLSWVAV